MKKIFFLSAIFLSFISLNCSDLNFSDLSSVVIRKLSVGASKLIQESKESVDAAINLLNYISLRTKYDGPHAYAGGWIIGFKNLEKIPKYDDVELIFILEKNFIYFIRHDIEFVDDNDCKFIVEQFARLGLDKRAMEDLINDRIKCYVSYKKRSEGPSWCCNWFFYDKYVCILKSLKVLIEKL